MTLKFKLNACTTGMHDGGLLMYRTELADYIQKIELQNFIGPQRKSHGT